ncbi:phosphate ABC transporter ATPase [Clostridium sp. 19966]|uniref:hypothetical protein n=1 Tax=Clostridium sp. 19966 TaxID=2768166 RepID=UPI0028DE4867|nr:hypothetical protein [Clostridium sp. 19966]MDT8718445.1 phosphate ABC transporter ATPase [Clostridium sp. 19966]
MKVDIGKHEFSIIWDGIYYHALSNYPNISEWELRGIIKFVDYENLQGRKVEIVSDSEEIIEKVNYALSNKNEFNNIEKPEKITECTACKQKGCITKYLCHTASVENAVSIIKSGSILSAVRARNISAEQLKLEARNAAKDPTDYFEYLMLSWGNCQAGDRLVMERKLEREPNEEDLSKGFTPGVRFFFKYDELVKHQDAVFDGYHPLKIKDELTLKDNVFAIIIPELYIERFKNIINEDIKDRVYYMNSKNKDIWEWSERVYKFIDKL